jgi:hypothetical protein
LSMYECSRNVAQAPHECFSMRTPTDNGTPFEENDHVQNAVLPDPA